ncbi:uncharacterized protein Z520_03784 [Fonsecaea multimorphosa CBS 102226]|uniref:Uncharacterized protein n=1 Tax=Fonsecaea multimorphosa CBS 102226 TaxID=1442371 RepID=A0A0D2KTK5_9EURO|nr:uncharacterized protein Z520_03784 [Fonsecaea multimorphosa CBS 102226]KIY00099.1 hypothetical protein Z520_03784 [Fonsecaea multimorphosa CBS 102226]OAL27296.1 hypothetical protein AYO22_03571 [Fonsecaea multimorphosa]
MRVSPLLTLLSALAATALTFICLLGGYSTTTLTNLDLFNLNVSQIANTKFNNGTGNGCNCVEFTNGTLTINGTAVINGTLTVQYAQLDIFEFYSVYAINYCEGDFLPSFQDPHASAVITHCETPSLSRRFDLVTIMETAMTRLGNALGEDISFDDLDWPNGITSAFVYVQSAVPAMIVFFLIGLSCLLLESFAAVWVLFTTSRTAVKFILITSVLALLSLTICAGIATAIITIVVNGVNANGEQIGVSANQGNVFLALIWIAVALLFVSTLTTSITLCVGPSRRKTHTRLREQDGYDMPPVALKRRPAPYYMHPPDSSYWDAFSSRRMLVDPRDREEEYYPYGEEFR